MQGHTEPVGIIGKRIEVRTRMTQWGFEMASGKIILEQLLTSEAVINLSDVKNNRVRIVLVMPSGFVRRSRMRQGLTGCQ